MVVVAYSTLVPSSSAQSTARPVVRARVEQLYAAWCAAYDKGDYMSAISLAEAVALCDYITYLARGDVRPVGGLTTNEAGRVIGVTRPTVLAMLQRGELSGELHAGRWWVDLASVQRAAAARRRK